VLQFTARRRIRYHQLGCWRLAADEMCLLTLIAAAQRHNTPQLDALAAWLVLPSRAEELGRHATDFGAALRHHGDMLPDRTHVPVTAELPAGEATRGRELQ
jgi:hypothetical protein